MRVSASRLYSIFPARILAAAGACLALLGAADAATPFSSATITKVENKVRYGDRQGGGNTRLAAVSDTVRANNILRSETDSRAEIQYPDGSVVRLGQNSVFTFESQSRTLSLEKGSMLFHIPKGSGGGTIKTASLTAAITGTAGKVSANMIVIVEGTVKLIPSGQLVHAGEYALRNGDGTITVDKYDPAHVNDGVLVHFNGLMPGFTETGIAAVTIPPPPFELRAFEVLTRTQNLPGSINHFLSTPKPDRPTPKEEQTPRPRNESTPRPATPRPRPTFNPSP